MRIDRPTGWTASSHSVPEGSSSRSGAFTESLRRLPLAFGLLIALFALTPATALAAGSATTKPATKVHHTTVVLNGHLDPEGDPGIIECNFEWGETLAYGNTVPCAEGNAFSAPADVSAQLSGLSPATTYHFRLHVETTSNGPFNGADQSFKTVPVPSQHQLIASFGSDGTSASTFGTAYSVSPAIHQATKKLYVSEAYEPGATPRLHGFDASAPPLFPLLSGFPFETTPTASGESTSMGVDNTALSTTGNVYFAPDNSGTVFGVHSNGAPLAGFPLMPSETPGPPVTSATSRNIGAIAVSSKGEVWVLTSSEEDPYGVIVKYSPTGAYLGSIDVSLPPGAPGVAHRFVLDAEDNIYVPNWQSEVTSLWKFSAASNYTSATELPAPLPNLWSVALDPSTGYLYGVTYTGELFVYDTASGELFGEFQTGGSGGGITVDATSHTVYVGRRLSDAGVLAYATGAPLSPPTVTTAPASSVTGSKATLNGFIDPEGTPVSQCKFEYGLRFTENDEVIRTYEKTTPCDMDPGSGSGDAAVSAEITGLTPNTVYHYRLVGANGSTIARGYNEVFTTRPPPVISSPATENITHNSAKLKAQVNPKGYATKYYFEYGTTTAYGTKVPEGDAGAGTGEVPVSTTIAGLAPDTLYHWRLVAENVNGITTMPDATFMTIGPVKAETTGSPIRTTTTAQLQGRVDPNEAPTTYRFEYGTEGPCDTNPCTATPDRSAGSGGVIVLVAEEIDGLEPDTTYHYRLIAENPTPGGPAIGEDMTVTTRASDAPLTHGRFPGPAGSDRAYEQVSLPDSGGNPVLLAYSVSDDGNRAFYRVLGGTPLSGQGSLMTGLYAERIETAPHQGAWRSENPFAPREDLIGSAWLEPGGPADLSEQVFMNNDTTSGALAIWRVRPGQQSTKLLQPTIASYWGPVVTSDDGSRVLVSLKGVHDPTHTPPNNNPNLYDISSGTPKLVGLMPDGSVPSCGSQIDGSSVYNVERARHWVSADGSKAFFTACNDLYLRDFVAETTKRISPSVTSDSAENFVRSTSETVFFVTKQSSDPDDSDDGGDLYGYDLTDETSECITCVVPNRSANINGTNNTIAVASDGSRAYFISPTALLPGAPASGIYRVKVASGDLAYVAPSALGVSERAVMGNALTPDGSAFVFVSNDPRLNSLGGQQNGGTQQYYRYDDRDRSLTCLSCPQDGSAAAVGLIAGDQVGLTDGTGANRTALSAEGGTFAFATTNALLAADQNTARPGQRATVGSDIYEWRDGRLLLVTDGLTNWPDNGPVVSAVTPSGKDIFFTAGKPYTPDAPDSLRRLYTARIGGGFEVPPPLKPCPLEVCQGTPKGAPEEQEPGSGNFSGPGNKVAAPPARRPCPKGRHKTRKAGKSRCVKRQSKAQQKKRQRAKHDRRAQR